MARLSARGRKEIARYERMVGEGQDKYRVSYVLMSDGWILKKGQFYNDDGTIRPGTWRRWKRLKAGNTPASIMEAMRGWDNTVEKVIRPDLVDTVLRSK